MATLPDHQIRSSILDPHPNTIRISDFNEKQLNPASYDLRLGDTLVLFPTNQWLPWETYRVVHLTEASPHITIAPGQFFLAHTRERIYVPTNMEAQIQLKSSTARRGFDHCLAGYIDPGFPKPKRSKQITLEMNNMLKEPQELELNMRICQIRFAFLASPVERPYGECGHYTDPNKSVELSWDTKTDKL